eukprot:scaffold7979_cov417-Prasinococcus_capsulatus_cf.AAC.15
MASLHCPRHVAWRDGNCRAAWLLRHATRSGGAAPVSPPLQVRRSPSPILRAPAQVCRSAAEATPSVAVTLPMGTTLQAFTVGTSRSRTPSPDLDGDLVVLMGAIECACKRIAALIRQSGLDGESVLHGYVDHGGSNAAGDAQKKLDVVSNDIMKEELHRCGVVKVMASEEDDGPIEVTSEGKYVVVFDPLDGSRNIECNIPTGTIFGVYRNEGNVLCKVSDAEL